MRYLLCVFCDLCIADLSPSTQTMLCAVQRALRRALNVGLSTWLMRSTAVVDPLSADTFGLRKSMSCDVINAFTFLITLLCGARHSDSPRYLRRKGVRHSLCHRPYCVVYAPSRTVNSVTLLVLFFLPSLRPSRCVSGFRPIAGHVVVRGAHDRSPHHSGHPRHNPPSSPHWPSCAPPQAAFALWTSQRTTRP